MTAFDSPQPTPQVSHWAQTVRYWSQIGPPLRPAPADIAIYESAAQAWIARHGAPRVLLFGVTPEIYRMHWPAGADFAAVDHSRPMIENVWPGPPQAVTCCNWLDLVLPAGSRDIGICDGGLHLISYPTQQAQLVHLLWHTLSEQGQFFLRLYTSPVAHESPRQVLEDLLAGRVSSMNLLKLRLGMALMENAAAGIELGLVWRTLHDAVPDLEELAERVGWTVEHTLAINAYRAAKTRYHFSSTKEVCDLFCKDPGGFTLADMHIPHYERGGQFPTLILQRNSSPPKKEACLG
jgi:hypothetical protein